MSPARLREEILAFMDEHADQTRDDPRLDDLLSRLATLQARAIPAYERLASRPQAHALPAAVPTDVFRFARLAMHPEERDVRVFRTSGTTRDARGTHALADLSLYERAATIQARHFLFPDGRPLRLVMLAPSPSEARDSSLSHMLGLFEARFGVESRYYLRDGRLDAAALEADLRTAEREGAPVALLGTSFAFVYAEDALGSVSFALPDGSRAMQTGGFKGKTREFSPDAMRQAIAERFGLPEGRIVSEYGMTELSSQFYEPSLRASLLGSPPPPRRYAPAPWVRALPVDPESLAPVAEGELGILRIDDLANFDSVACIQTSDLARRRGDAIELLGRAPEATPRGCSLALDELLGGDA